MARIAIIGVGAIGAIIASLLQQAGHELVLCVRRPLAELTVETPDGPVAVRATIVTDPAKIAAVDWVIVATKAYDAASAAKWLKQLRADGAPVAVLQNGVEHRERFAPYVPMDSILPVIVDCPAERQSPERVRQRGIMHLKAPEGELGRAFIHLFAGTAADAVEVSDFITVAWRKLCHNAAGVLPALLLQPSGVLHDEAIGETALQIVRECIAVGRAEGATLDNDVAEAVLQAYRAAPADGINSLHADRLAHRPMEIDARNGVIVRLGKKHGIATPCNQMAVALLERMAKAKD
ncbi:2-dehydropantoate 2-reductase [Edaphobacter dinghuensis]|uniref:2-dehydropantoate 2-reductase n=1 Tax=Edaphobacter dinghuensis TaxID=1560005 RepID=A0A917HHH4_9BACT|nr:2-dehydropantoate 2-reductase [Edaphobacter dinghuensis]GGG79739.1 putative 2-dehydropantoate 2-reductase [Edaphobacter dinghuensis]